MPKYLIVPYHEKEQVKALGDKWDKQEKKWFIPDGIEKKPFVRWMLMDSVNVRAERFCLAESFDICWKCKQASPVFSFFLPACETLDWDEYGKYWQNEFGIMLCNIRFLKEDVYQMMAHIHPQYKADFSNTVEYPYYMNHCAHCGAKLGDFYLHDEIGASFNPDEHSPQILSLLERHKPFQAHASWHGSSVLDLLSRQNGYPD